MSLLVLLAIALPGQFETVASKDFSAAFQRNALISTVRIRNKTNGFVGTGAILKNEGGYVFFLTAEHVVAGADGLEIETFSSESYPNPDKVYNGAEVMAKLHDPDIALLRLSTRDRPAGGVRICPPRLIPKEKSFPVLGVGCSDGAAPTCRVDVVIDSKQVRKEPLAKSSLVWEVKSQHVPGRSGGPLFDARGNLIGVCSGTTKAHGYFCHTQEIHDMLKAKGFAYLFAAKSD